MIALSKAARSRGLALTYDPDFPPVIQLLHETQLRTLVRRALIVAAHRTHAVDAHAHAHAHARADALIVADFALAIKLASED